MTINEQDVDARLLRSLQLTDADGQRKTVAQVTTLCRGLGWEQPFVCIYVDLGHQAGVPSQVFQQ